ncbi:hypothetical protein [Erwinia pyrifoliae]|uniref:Uncharacterized protein n=1 Tax=Erwinia pyrifoliae TaxID=79967 RepID=A0ABY5X423_ERWPY|nr:hypothetical protein [Erwinia pyrifoliae]MCT2388602.1 hypothetical protein [Erwinia pyrifoliae]MCU8586771.1 hypothetical protein [Erwinia pyrifoliae]UWS32128.1 hypothetical protein NYP84_10645 [Erwinia pyrifoliae]UXK13661.1 hypothetical protein NYP80_07620 [Erwinia pyrifoliae]
MDAEVIKRLFVYESGEKLVLGDGVLKIENLTDQLKQALEGGRPVVFSNGVDDKELVEFLGLLIIELDTRSKQTGKAQELRERADEIETKMKRRDETIMKAVFPLSLCSTHKSHIGFLV